MIAESFGGFGVEAHADFHGRLEPPNEVVSQLQRQGIGRSFEQPQMQGRLAVHLGNGRLVDAGQIGNQVRQFLVVRFADFVQPERFFCRLENAHFR